MGFRSELRALRLRSRGGIYQLTDLVDTSGKTSLADLRSSQDWYLSYYPALGARA